MAGTNNNRLRLLGEWRLELDSSIVPIRGLRTRALLTLLACEHDRVHLRSALSTILWPDVSAEKARASLRRAIADLRGAIGDHGDVLECDRMQARVHGNKLATDIHGLIGRLENGNVDLPELETLIHLPGALSEFQSISGEMDDWVRSTRTALLDRADAGLSKIYEDASVDVPGRLRAALLAFRLDSFNEAAARAIIDCLVASNQMSKAIRFYDELYERFEEELDTAPSLATQDKIAAVKLELYGQITAPDPPRVVNARATVSTRAATEETTIAVLPFEELGPTAPPDYVRLGLLDEITCHLAGALTPSPISSNTMRRYIGMSVPEPHDLRQEIGARYVVSGSIRSDRSTAIVTVELADAVSRKVVWAEVFRCQYSEIIDLHSQIAPRIVRSIVPSLGGAELKRTQAFKVEDLEPFHLVLKARELILSLSRDAFLEAGKLLEIAMSKGPHFAPAYALAADWHSVRIWQGWSDDANEDETMLEHQARRALELRPTDGRVMALLAHNRLIFVRKYTEALDYFDKALTLLPGDSETLIWTVPGLSYAGQTQKAVENGERAHRLSPFDPFRFRNQHFLSIAHYASGHYDAAAELGLLSFEDNPTYVSNLRFTIASTFAAGDIRKSRELVVYHNSIQPEFRVGELIARHPFRDEEKRLRYGKHLVDAGLNP